MDQPKNCEGAWPQNSAYSARQSRQDHRIKLRLLRGAADCGQRGETAGAVAEAARIKERRGRGEVGDTSRRPRSVARLKRRTGQLPQGARGIPARHQLRALLGCSHLSKSTTLAIVPSTTSAVAPAGMPTSIPMIIIYPRYIAGVGTRNSIGNCCCNGRDRCRI